MRTFSVLASALLFQCIGFSLSEDIRDYARPVGRKWTSDKNKQRKLNIQDYSHPVGRGKNPKNLKLKDQDEITHDSYTADKTTLSLAMEETKNQNTDRMLQNLIEKIKDFLQRRFSEPRTVMNIRLVQKADHDYQQPRRKLSAFFGRLREKCDTGDSNSPGCKLYKLLAGLNN
ncbi:uncharacterized protein LOC111131677 isoform X2 [Crassostrea virginica]